jgi:transcriptional regulator with XRE-family HTH domain
MDTLAEPEVGARIRHLREERGLSLRTLAERSGLSANAISLIERGVSSPTVVSLHQLATALGVSITEFFEQSPASTAIHVKKMDGVRFHGSGFDMESLGSGLPGQQLEPFRITITPRFEPPDEPLTHPGQEFVYCIEGQVEYTVEDRRYLLQAGDSLLLEGWRPHCWGNPFAEPATLLVVFQAVQDLPLVRQRHLQQ